MLRTHSIRTNRTRTQRWRVQIEWERWEKKESLEKSVARFFSLFSAIFWFQCTHDLEHIQILCLLLLFFFNVYIMWPIHYRNVCILLVALPRQSDREKEQKISSRYRTCTAASNRIWLQSMDTIAAIPFFTFCSNAMSSLSHSLYLYIYFRFVLCIVRTIFHVKILNCFVMSLFFSRHSIIVLSITQWFQMRDNFLVEWQKWFSFFTSSFFSLIFQRFVFYVFCDSFKLFCK